MVPESGQGHNLCLAAIQQLLVHLRHKATNHKQFCGKVHTHIQINCDPPKMRKHANTQQTLRYSMLQAVKRLGKLWGEHQHSCKIRLWTSMEGA